MTTVGMVLSFVVLYLGGLLMVWALCRVAARGDGR